MTKIYLILLCSGLSLIGRTQYRSSFPNFSFSDTSKPFIKDIHTHAYNDIVNFEKQLNLESLAQGYNGLQIRVWEGWMASISLTIISGQDSKWKANYFDLQIGLISNTDNNFKIIKQSMKPVFPGSGWTAFSQKLLKSNIMTCPDESKLSDYSMMVDGTHYFIEVATNDQYRLYTSSHPFPRQKISEERKSLMQILDYIRHDLSAYPIK
jgi:hypothetical protein